MSVRRPGAVDVRLRRLDTDEALDRADELGRVWTGSDEARIRGIFPRHAGRAGFRLVAAEDWEGDLVGFAYGYLGAPGQWWHDVVARALSREARRRWLAPGHFELAELHVAPDHRLRGIGGALHDEVLEGVSLAVLSTQSDNRPAHALYEGRGWTVVLPELDFGSGRPFAILGREAPA